MYMYSSMHSRKKDLLKAALSAWSTPCFVVKQPCSASPIIIFSVYGESAWLHWCIVTECLVCQSQQVQVSSSQKAKGILDYRACVSASYRKLTAHLWQVHTSQWWQELAPFLGHKHVTLQLQYTTPTYQVLFNIALSHRVAKKGRKSSISYPCSQTMPSPQIVQ